MKLKRAVAICGFFLISLVIFMMYAAKDLTGFSTKKSVNEEFQENKWLHFEDRIKQLEADLNKHNEAVGEIKQAMRQIMQPNASTPTRGHPKPLKIVNVNNILPASEMEYEKTCPLVVDYAPKQTVQMLDVYKSLKFDNPDGGAWKQGWKIEVDEMRWNKKHRLKVFVVPHSHNDPGWLKTVEEYYNMQTKFILDNMLEKLAEDRRRKFIWAEISYFAMWWDNLSEENRKKVKWYLKNKQLEIVTGGWVMNDEANSHWISIVHQLTDGHQWLQKHLNYTPKSSWSIDPFGMSATQPLLLKEAGLKNSLIQRVHYSVKKHLARQTHLEFLWRQLWDNTGNTELFTHMMPFYSYDIPHTCGPDPAVCCQFDFKRLPGHGLHCPWKITPRQITDANVAQRATLLLDQYRKKAQLFKTNVLLVPLGDDFRYDHPTEWDVQYRNYQKLFDYLNSDPKLHVQAQFGTLSDYFEAVRDEKDTKQFPTLSGDFFTYADRDDHYWSGYYTSRPFYKRMDRVLLSYIRSAEIILTLTKLSGKPGSVWITDTTEKSLADARRHLSLFQHHDGVTGTAKDHVVVDYGIKMLSAISSAQNVLQLCAHALLNGVGAEIPQNQAVFYNVDDMRPQHDSLSQHYTITIGPELNTKKVVLFNSLTFNRVEVVTFFVSTPYVQVLEFNGKLVKCQVSPVFEQGAAMSQSKYQLSFIANIPALSLVSYVINAVQEEDLPPQTKFSDVKFYNHNADLQPPPGFPDIEVSPTANEFTLHNTLVTATFNNLGLLKAVKIRANTIPVHLDFAKYGVRHTVERSGAYLFLPDGDASEIRSENTLVKIVDGPIYSAVIVQLPFVQHTVTLYNTPGADGLGLEIENLVDISTTHNFELVMRLSTNINSSDDFFTDLNGYQIIRRKRFKKLPLQANYYPMPTATYIEDTNTRLTLLTGSPVGSSSLKEGQIEVMLDRRLNQDDNLGLGQGVLDNRPTKHVFRLILERKTHKCQTSTDSHPSGFLSLSAHVASQSLLNPLIRLLRTEDEDMTSQNVYAPVISPFGVDFTLSSLRSDIYFNGSYYYGVVIHRQHLDICFVNRVELQQFPLSHGKVNLLRLLPNIVNTIGYTASLSYVQIKNTQDFTDDISMCPMQVQAFLLKR